MNVAANRCHNCATPGFGAKTAISLNYHTGSKQSAGRIESVIGAPLTDLLWIHMAQVSSLGPGLFVCESTEAI